jgi:hypothetical protein
MLFQCFAWQACYSTRLRGICFRFAWPRYAFCFALPCSFAHLTWLVAWLSCLPCRTGGISSSSSLKREGAFVPPPTILQRRRSADGSIPGCSDHTKLQADIHLKTPTSTFTELSNETCQTVATVSHISLHRQQQQPQWQRTCSEATNRMQQGKPCTPAVPE